MAQTEDTELRDLVIEALEKNGSLAKIRALLRANIFLAFEDECVHMRQNVNLDNLLKGPEGILALSIVHEFLEACNLKNTLFVYKSESRQGKDYNYHGKKFLSDRVLGKNEHSKEPVLLSLLKNIGKYKRNKQVDTQFTDNSADYKDEQNNSYIVHDDSQSSATNSSQSDHSSDEKNKLHLRLNLENSDTDTSSSTDSTRDKSSSEYIPSDHVLDISKAHHTETSKSNEKNVHKQSEHELPYFSKIPGNNTSDSTSYADIKQFSAIDEKAFNTMGLPYNETEVPHLNHHNNIQNDPPKDSAKSGGTLSSVSSLSLRNESSKNELEIKSPHKLSKSDGETADYTNDFTSSQASKKKITSEEPLSPNHDDYKISPTPSPRENSQSSISISDVADLISEKSNSYDQNLHYEKSLENEKSMFSSNNSNKKSGSILNKHSDDSGDFSESPVPSLSNIGLDIHSD